MDSTLLAIARTIARLNAMKEMRWCTLTTKALCFQVSEVYGKQLVSRPTSKTATSLCAMSSAQLGGMMEISLLPPHPNPINLIRYRIHKKTSSRNGPGWELMVYWLKHAIRLVRATRMARPSRAFSFTILRRFALRYHLSLSDRAEPMQQAAKRVRCTRKAARNIQAGLCTMQKLHYGRGMSKAALVAGGV